MILAPSHFPAIGAQIRAGQVMVMAHFRPADAGEKAFRLVRASAFRRIGVLVIDALRQKDRMKLVPMGSFVGMNDGIRRDPLGNRFNGFAL